LSGGLRRIEGVQAEAFEDMADEGGRVPLDELLMLFKGGRLRATLSARPGFSSGIASLALLQAGPCGQAESCFANYTTCPVLLAPRHGKNGTSPRPS